jgi:hypothetical protein
MPPGTGESAVIVPVPAAEPVVSTWRERCDASARQGMPAHITALYPFLHEARLTGDVVERLAELCSAVPVLDVWFRRTARFDDVLYLEPEPAGELRALTGAIAERWPEAPPYGGIFDEVIPHLTVAHGIGPDGLNDAEADVMRHLPFGAALEEACLFVFDGHRWQPRARLPFRAHRSGGWPEMPSGA